MKVTGMEWHLRTLRQSRVRNISHLDISAGAGMFAKPEFIDASFNLEEP
jgi:hypothetical protein